MQRDELYKVLRHPIREKIIILLHNRGSMSYSELKNELNIEPGKLYYHLGILKNLVSQDKDKRYFLTDLGEYAYTLLTSSSVSDEFIPLLRKGFRGRFFLFLSGEPLIRYLYNVPHRHLVESLLIVLFGSWIVSRVKLNPVLLFLLKYPFKSMPFSYLVSFKGSTLIIVSFIINFIVVYSLSILLSALIFKKYAGNLSLFVGVSVSYIPLILYAIFQLVFREFAINPPLWADNILFIFMQSWCMCILSSAIALSKNLSFWKAVLIVLVIVYINVFYILFFITGF